ncbi:MAG: hypothetical protein LBD24_01470 [Spirochaetaceae bacterium]|jgi:hypothetical protein|nr:hypothetical protein [Spirochaetaceae bacterium]
MKILRLSLAALLGLLGSSLQLFALPAQEEQLSNALQLRQDASTVRTSGAVQTVAGEDGSIPVIRDGETLVIEKGDLKVRLPLATDRERLREIIKLLDEGRIDPPLITGQWEVIEQPENIPYVSFEFTKERGFIIIERDGAVRQARIGSYTIEQERDLVLGSLASMQKIILQEDEMAFSFSTETQYNLPMKIRRVEPKVSGSLQTDWLCRTWKLSKREGTEERDGLSADSIIFSAAGSYIVTYPAKEQGLAQWEWVDDKTLIYTWEWDNWDNPGILEVEGLSAALLRVKDEDGAVYEFTPAYK